MELKPQRRQLKCNHCGGTNHDDDHCFKLHPELRPTSSGLAKSEREKTLEMKIAELEDKLKTSASLA